MRAAVFLDFDGVICDSNLECLVSSWLAYHHHFLNSVPTHAPVTLRRQFTHLRPYVRSGEDFVLIQELLDRGTEIRSQEDFDLVAEARGSWLMGQYKELFYAARAQLLQADRQYWLGLNRLYSHVLEALPAWAASACFYIISTKKPEYICEILSNNGIQMTQDRVLYCRSRGKRELIAQVLRTKGVSRALFIDDQIDHLLDRAHTEPLIEVALASWGYLKEEWLTVAQRAAVEILRPEQVAPRLELLLRSCRPFRR